MLCINTHRIGFVSPLLNYYSGIIHTSNQFADIKYVIIVETPGSCRIILCSIQSKSDNQKLRIKFLDNPDTLGYGFFVKINCDGFRQRKIIIIPLYIPAPPRLPGMSTLYSCKDLLYRMSCSGGSLKNLV